MKRLIIYCEGPTEESFINNVLAPHLGYSAISVTPIVYESSRTPLKKHKGGNYYPKIKKELSRLCKSDPTAVFTTMFDYYGLSDNTPGVSTASGNIYEKAQHVERAIETDLGTKNLFFNLAMHEFEGLLFTDTAAFANITDADGITKLEKIKTSFDTPEHINNSVETAPSKRIENIIKTYSKITNGTIIAERIGITAIAAECKHFSNWLAKIQAHCHSQN